MRWYITCGLRIMQEAGMARARHAICEHLTPGLTGPGTQTADDT